MADGERIIHTTGLNNCGGRCVIHAHVRDGEIVKLTTDTRRDAGDGVPLCACAKGLNYHKTFLGPDRLLHPMKRVGPRGEGLFQRITWDEALDTIAREWVRIRDTYGPGSRYVNYATGDSGALAANRCAQRLLALDGGYLGRYNSYSTACVSQVSRLMYGTTMTGNAPEDWLNSRLIILWGHNPAETRFDAATMHYLRQARDRGIPIVVVDPRQNDTALALGAEWLPLRPATDAALMDAMAWVIADRGLADRDFLDRCCLGYDRAHMPEGVDPGLCVLDYLTGARDGVPKTPAWAEAITGVPAAKIEDLALRYATARPAALIQGWGPQRHAYGEQAARGGILLACMTGNVGVSGGWACGHGDCQRHAMPALPQPENPYGRAIPAYLWTEAVLRGRALTDRDGVTGGKGLDSDVKMIVNLAGNCLINQHGDIHRTAEILRDTSKCEFILCSDLFMTSSARFADILLPGVSMFECENLTMPWLYGDFLGCVNPAIPPLGECRQEYAWLRELAERLGLEPAFSQGRDAGQWLRWMYEDLRQKEPELPDYEAFRAAGIHRYRNNPPRIAFEAQRRDPEGCPFPTPSGKVELFSPAAYRGAFSDAFPPIPRYVAAPEGPEDPLRARYPLQLIGWHTKRRCHSIHDNNPALRRLDPQRLWLNPWDAAARGIADGDEVLVWNDRGRTRVPAHVTERIVAGAAALSQGAWFSPDDTGTDTAGSINVLTSLRPTPFARGNGQHTVLAQTAKLMPEDWLRGRRLLCLGSSVTHGEAAGGWSFADALSERWGMAVTKAAVSGTTLADLGPDAYPARLRRLEAPGFDFALVQLSTNDAAQGVPLGREDDADPATVTGAIRAIVGTIRAKWGQVPTAFYTSPRFDSPAYGAMVDRLRAVAPALGIGVIDLWNDRAFNALPGERYAAWMADPIHPTREGYARWLAPRIALGLRAGGRV